MSANQNQSLNTGPIELTNQNHLITENCGVRAFDIVERDDQVKWLAASALVNARRYGTRSDFGFKAMFKNDEAQQAVVAILDHIYNFKGLPNLRPRPDLLSTPRLCESSFLTHHFLFHQPLGAGDPFRLQRYGSLFYKREMLTPKSLQPA